MDTKKYKTRCILEKKNNPFVKDDIWTIAIDVGYSAVKGYARNFIYCFPAIAKKLPKSLVSLGKPEDTDILFRDSNGEMYAVGLNAEVFISKDSTTDSNAVLYGRNRYYTENFRICMLTGLALGMQTNEYGSPEGKRIKIQTGLPSLYVIDDSPLLKDAFSGDFDFELKIGKNDWQRFSFSLSRGDIEVMQQPMGSFVSASIDKNGRPTPDCNALYNANKLVFDPGFKTGDCCLIRKQNKILTEESQTFEDLSMWTVLSKTTAEIAERYGENIPVPAFQSYLETGYIKSIDRRALKSTKVDFSDILEAKSREVCEAAIDKLSSVYNAFDEIDYLILTGGTGAAWSNIIRERLKDMDSLTIISANRNEELPHIFSNVRGYYMYAIHQN